MSVSNDQIPSLIRRVSGIAEGDLPDRVLRCSPFSSALFGVPLPDECGAHARLGQYGRISEALRATEFGVTAFIMTVGSKRYNQVKVETAEV